MINHKGCSQNYGPFFVLHYIMAPIIQENQNGTLILGTTLEECASRFLQITSFFMLSTRFLQSTYATRSLQSIATQRVLRNAFMLAIRAWITRVVRTL